MIPNNLLINILLIGMNKIYIFIKYVFMPVSKVKLVMNIQDLRQLEVDI